MSFKIIAIKALKDCDPKYVKVLEEEQLYYFLQDYSIFTNTDGEEEINIQKSTPTKLYNVKGTTKDIAVNISAIVGKNGSGKSTVIELLFRAINNIAYKFKGEKKEDTTNTITADIQKLEGLKVVFYYQLKDIIAKVEVIDTNFNVFAFDKKNDTKYVLNNKAIEGFQLQKLFYTEVINYSHYAYNSEYEGPWIQKLFHKNDSYQTPVVFNPMRTKGNININRENELVRQRLIANLLRPMKSESFNFRKIGDNFEALKIKLSLKTQKDFVIINLEPEEKFGLSGFDGIVRNKLLEKSVQLIIDENFELTDHIKNTPNFNHCRAYILYKLISIAIKYEEYESYFYKITKEFNQRKLDEYLIKPKIRS